MVAAATAQKMKELPTYITEILNDKEALENHYKVTKALYEHEIDFRQMNSLKLGFLRADKEHHHALPVEEFRKIFRATMKEHCDSQIEYKVLHLITVRSFLGLLSARMLMASASSSCRSIGWLTSTTTSRFSSRKIETSHRSCTTFFRRIPLATPL